MPRATWLADVLRQAGLDVVEVSGWKSRGRSDFEPRWQVDHHTASGSVQLPAPSLRLCIDGRGGSDPVPGPLCNLLVGRDGRVHLIAAGRANHAGRGRYPDGAHGNRYSIGWEIENNGIGEKWSPTLLDVVYRGNAAINLRMGWSSDRVIGHKEYTARKIDPFPLSMGTVRQNVQRAMKDPSKSQEGTAEPGEERVWRTGDEGKAVVELQRLLNAWVQWDNRWREHPSNPHRARARDLPPLAEDGDFGQRTAGRLAAIERAVGLEGDGIADPMDLVMISNAVHLARTRIHSFQPHPRRAEP